MLYLRPRGIEWYIVRKEKYLEVESKGKDTGMGGNMRKKQRGKGKDEGIERKKRNQERGVIEEENESRSEKIRK